MKGRMQKIPTQSDSRPPKDRPEAESYEGVQTYMDVEEGCLTTEQPKTEYPLLEQILSPANLNSAYLQVKRNGGAAGIDKMDCDRLLGYLIEHGEELKERIRQRTYRPNPVRRVEIPKDNGGKRQLGIPTVVDRMFQQAIAQVLSSIYERQFSDGSYGFRPKRGGKRALIAATKIVERGYHYAVDIDLERFFDTVNHAKLIEILQRTIKDNAVISLIHRYLNAGVMNGGKYEPSEEGTPQGGPLSPLLANIMLDELDKELEKTRTSVRALCRRRINLQSEQTRGRTRQRKYQQVHRGSPQIKGQPRKDRSRLHRQTKIPRLRLLCPQRQMPPATASEDRSQISPPPQSHYFEKQWNGVWQAQSRPAAIPARVDGIL